MAKMTEVDRDDVIRFLRDVRAEARLEPHITDGSIDVRLQLIGGSYELHYGDASYDTDHRGSWGAGTVDRDATDDDLATIADDMIREAQDDEACQVDEDEEPEPDDDSITTTDERHWYQYGKLYVEGGRAAVKAKMDADKFWPDVFVISDHGNAVCISADLSAPSL